MSLNIGCLVRRFDWMGRWRAPAALDWLERQGFSAQSEQVDEAHPEYFQDSHQMVVFSQKSQEIWLGLGVSHLFNKLCQSQEFKGLGEGIAMVADDAMAITAFKSSRAVRPVGARRLQPPPPACGCAPPQTGSQAPNGPRRPNRSRIFWVRGSR